MLNILKEFKNIFFVNNIHNLLSQNIYLDSIKTSASSFLSITAAINSRPSITYSNNKEINNIIKYYRIIILILNKMW